MRRLETTLASILVVWILGAPSAADTTDGAILGTWKTPKHDGKVVIEECGAAICGRVTDGRELRANPNQTDARNPDASKRERKILGLNILEGYTGGPTEWTGGTVYDPQTGDSSSDSTLTLQSPNTLVVKGCRLVFCRSETWTKIASSGR
jgi:uncharacterized protein (DUF2147 family)